MTRVLFLYFFLPGLLSDIQPVNRAYVVRIDPKLPRPDTRADAAATPTSPWRCWKIWLVQVIVMGTVGPRPKPTNKRPPYRGHGVVP